MENSFTDQVAVHALALKGYALFLTQNRDDAHDLLQETYLKAFSNRERFAPDTNLKGWLYTIMKNTFINNYRRKVKRNTFSDHTEQDSYINQPSQHIPDQFGIPIGTVKTRIHLARKALKRKLSVYGDLYGLNAA